MPDYQADTTIGQLYEDVEKFFGDIFAFYGKLVARWPFAFILLPLISCAFLGLGLCNVSYEYHRQALFASGESPAQEDLDRLEQVVQGYIGHFLLFVSTTDTTCKGIHYLIKEGQEWKHNGHRCQKQNQGYLQHSSKLVRVSRRRTIWI